MSEVEESFISSGAILVALMIGFYMFMGALIEKYKFPIGHEASLSIVVGAMISLLIMAIDKQDLLDMLTFNQNYFFYVCLPPIVFSTGFNMKRQAFFGNLGNILMFGLVNTCIQFTLFSSMTYLYF